jgi:hypothetical protein
MCQPHGSSHVVICLPIATFAQLSARSASAPGRHLSGDCAGLRSRAIAVDLPRMCPGAGEREAPSCKASGALARLLHMGSGSVEAGPRGLRVAGTRLPAKLSCPKPIWVRAAEIRKGLGFLAGPRE